MHKTYIACLIALIFICVPYLTHAIGFGGLVTAIQPCDEGELLYVDEPLLGEVTYMWYEGELPYAFYVPPHPAQYLLGDSAVAPAVCTIDDVPSGEGFPIIFHGDSL